MVGRVLDWTEELGRWLKPFLDRLGHKARRQMCPRYVSGLIGPGDRKSIQPMAERLALGDYDQWHHFIAAGVWDATPVETELLVQADRLVGGADAVLVIDDTAIPKKGTHSVGVAAQYASALGKTANCQTLVSLTLARGEVPVMLALRLFLPESWTSKPARLKRAGVPAEYRTARTKPEMALAELDRVIAAGVRFGCVLADAGYGMSAPFRQGLTARKLAWAVGIPRHLKVYPADVQMIRPVVRRGRPRRKHVPDVPSISAEDMLITAKWQNISWRTGTKGKLKARFAAVRVRVADGPAQWIRDTHCLTRNVTEQVPADDWGGGTESGRCRRWREGSAWAHGARCYRRWRSGIGRPSGRRRGASSTSYARQQVGIASTRCAHLGNARLSRRASSWRRESAVADTARRPRMC